MVVIFLGTNDMDVDRASQQPSQAAFTQKYQRLLQRVWTAYGKRASLKIVAACGGTSTSSFVAPSRYCPWVAYIVMAYVRIAYIVMAYIVMAYIAIAYIVMAYIIIVTLPLLPLGASSG